MYTCEFIHLCVHHTSKHTHKCVQTSKHTQMYLQTSMEACLKKSWVSERPNQIKMFTCIGHWPITKHKQVFTHKGTLLHLVHVSISRIKSVDNTDQQFATEDIFTAHTYGGQREMIRCIPCSVSVMATDSSVITPRSA